MGEYRCEVCGKVYKYKSCLEKHVSNGHSLVRSVKVDDGYKCSVCDKKFASFNNVNAHLKRHEIGDQHVWLCCALCGERCVHQYQLNRHRCDALDTKLLLIESVIEGKAGNYKCAVCNKRFNIKNSWERHMDVHLGLQRFQCPMCDRKYSESRDLNNHIRTHTGECPFKCSWCPQRFHTKGILQEHERRHKKAKCIFYVCCICGSFFGEKCKMQAHQCGTKQKGSTGRITKYVCNVCGRSYAFMSAMKKHMKSHTATHPNACFRCGKVFRSKESFKKHHMKERVVSSPLAGKTRRKFVRDDNVGGTKKHRGRPRLSLVICHTGKQRNEDKSLQKHHMKRGVTSSSLGHKTRKKIVGGDGDSSGTKKGRCHPPKPLLICHTVEQPNEDKSVKKHHMKGGVTSSSLGGKTTRREIAGNDGDTGGTKKCRGRPPKPLLISHTVEQPNEDKSVKKHHMRECVVSIRSLDDKRTYKNIVRNEGAGGTKKLKASRCQHEESRNNFRQTVGMKGLVNDVHSSGECIQVEDLYHCPVDGKNVTPVQEETMRISKGEDTLIFCVMCGERFVSRYDLCRHRCDALDSELLLKGDTSNKSDHECAVCKKKFLYAQSWQRHMIVHLGQQKYQCSVCDKKFTEKRELKDHMRTHTGDDAYKCKWCPKSYCSKRALDKHEKGVHEIGHWCNDCGKHFRSIATFRRHMVLHAAPHPYHCSLCGERFRARWGIWEHRKRVHHLSGSRQNLEADSEMPDISTMVEEKCGDNQIHDESSKVMPDLSMHCVEDTDNSPDIYIVTNGADLQGSVDCAVVPDLTRHCLEENDNSPYMAEVDDGQELCDNRVMSDLNKHILEEEYQCFLCDRKLATEDALKTHLEIHCS